jgi:DNA-binding PadR family transcriptional regulator
MAKIVLSDCDKMVRKALLQHGCQTSHQLRTYSNRVFNEDYSVGSIGAALRKLVAKGYGAYSDNEKGQKVYWLTDFGREAIMKEEVGC